MDILSDLLVEYPDILEWTYDHFGEKLSTKRVILFWTREDKTLERDYPGITERLSKLTPPLTINQYFHRMRQASKGKSKERINKGRATSDKPTAVYMREWRARRRALGIQA